MPLSAQPAQPASPPARQPASPPARGNAKLLFEQPIFANSMSQFRITNSQPESDSHCSNDHRESSAQLDLDASWSASLRGGNWDGALTALARTSYDGRCCNESWVGLRVGDAIAGWFEMHERVLLARRHCESSGWRAERAYGDSELDLPTREQLTHLHSS